MQDLGGGQWQAAVPLAPQTPFFVQAVDAAGNVAADVNGGVYHRFDSAQGGRLYLPLTGRGE